MRSLLFVPADGGKKLDKAMASGADAVIAMPAASGRSCSRILTFMRMLPMRVSPGVHAIRSSRTCMPTFSKTGIALHWLDFAAPAAIGSAFALLFWNRMKAHALLPVGDPRFEQAMHFQNV